MSKEALAKVVQRAISDGAFRRQLSTDPTGALRGFDLTSDEASAIRAADAGRLSALGVDQRMSKAFTLGGGAEAATKLGGTDITGTYGSAITTGGAGTAGGNALVSGDTSDTDALIGGDAGRAGSAVTSGQDGLATVIPSDPALASDALTSDPAHAFGAVTGGGDPMLGNTLTAGNVDGAGEMYPSDPRTGDVFAGNTDAANDMYPNDPRTGDVFAGNTDAANELYPSDPRTSDVFAGNADAAHTYSGDDLAGPGYGDALTSDGGDGGSSLPSDSSGGHELSQ